MKSVVPPAAVAREAARGLKLRASLPPSKRCCTTVGLRRASQLKNRQPVSLRTLKRMKAYFDRHRADKKGRGWGVDSKGYQAWLLWGGDAGYAWAKQMLKRYERNAFQARPAEFAGPVTRGVAEYPGFHTASDKDTTYAYAQVKAVPESWDYDPGDDLRDFTLNDYLVVVSLDMSGLRAEVDYDAVTTVRPILCDIARQLVGEHEEPIDVLMSYVEEGQDWGREIPKQAIEWLFEYGSSVTLDPGPSLFAYAEEQSDPNAFLEALASGTLPDEALAEITGQFRYTDNVSSDRIVEVWYVQPWWPNILDFERNESDGELADELETLNWSVVDMDNVFNHTLNEKEHSVWKRKAAPGMRIEYHGTGYRNLVKAAPDIDWPIPPHPYA